MHMRATLMDESINFSFLFVKIFHLLNLRLHLYIKLSMFVHKAPRKNRERERENILIHYFHDYMHFFYNFKLWANCKIWKIILQILHFAQDVYKSPIVYTV